MLMPCRPQRAKKSDAKMIRSNIAFASVTTTAREAVGPEQAFMDHELSPNVSRIRKGAAMARDHEPGQKQGSMKTPLSATKSFGF
jgi:hypothetical protein